MPIGENVLAVSVGRGWAAAATDRQLVRIFTSSGLQVGHGMSCVVASLFSPLSQWRAMVVMEHLGGCFSATICVRSRICHVFRGNFSVGLHGACLLRRLSLVPYRRFTYSLCLSIFARIVDCLPTLHARGSSLHASRACLVFLCPFGERRARPSCCPGPW